jgi:hypothetical protein
MGHIGPVFFKNMRHLKIKDGLIGINGAVDFELVGFINDPLMHVGGRSHGVAEVFKKKFSCSQ